MKVSILNLCTDLKLVNRGYFSNGTDWDESPAVEIDTGNVMKSDLTPLLSTFEGVLAYELQREHEKSNEQFESTYILCFIAWKFKGYKKFHLFVHLIEHDEYIDWNGIKLREYYQRHANQLCVYTGPIKNAWMIYDNTMISTILTLNFTQRDSVLNIIISDRIKNNRAEKPIWINPERWASLESKLF
jgi:hypothetical protein